ncbi:MAG TPA: NAD(P)-dependent oxidoreductase, partial [Spirochaetia bacterium]|nr:NAD(P)-dependent oxidoreductase [Spirochaetia bacterium]
IHVYDPWLPENLLREQGLIPASLKEVLSDSRVIFVLAGATSENRAMLGRSELNLISKGAAFVLASRASLVDFDALTEHLKSGRFSAAIDVFPEEPFAAHHPIRSLPNVLLSAHRAGGIAESYLMMGEMVVDDLSLILQGLAPVRLQRASRETVGRMQSKPVG